MLPLIGLTNFHRNAYTARLTRRPRFPQRHPVL